MKRLLIQLLLLSPLFASDGTLTYSRTVLLRDYQPPMVETFPVPPQPNATCVRVELAGEVIRTYQTMQHGFGEVQISEMRDFLALLPPDAQDADDALIVAELVTPFTTTGFVPPNTQTTFVYIHTVSPFEMVITDPETLQKFQQGTAVLVVGAASGGFITCSGSCGVRISDHQSLRGTWEVYQ